VQQQLITDNYDKVKNPASATWFLYTTALFAHAVRVIKALAAVTSDTTAYNSHGALYGKPTTLYDVMLVRLVSPWNRNKCNALWFV